MESRTKIMLLRMMPALAIIVLWVGLLLSHAESVTATEINPCPSPQPTCSSPGALSDVAGTFGCTSTRITAQVGSKGELKILTADGAGNISGNVVENKNDTSGDTFQGFMASSETSYCINTDGTGYIFRSGGDCPLAFILDRSKGELRILDSTANQAGTHVCKKR